MPVLHVTTKWPPALTYFIHLPTNTESTSSLRKWKLPESLQESTEFHHNPGMAQRFPRDTALIHIADVVADALQYGSSGDPHVAPMDPQAWRLADLSDDTISTVISEVEQQFNSAMELFQPEPRSMAANLH